MDRDALARLARTALPILAVLSFAAGSAATLAVAGDTLGYDFLAYHQAIERVDQRRRRCTTCRSPSPAASGSSTTRRPSRRCCCRSPCCPPQTATWVWIGLSLVAFLVGVAILPVSRSVRWWIVLLAGLSFPFVYAVKLGQVGPILFLAFAVGWRGIDDPIRLGAVPRSGPRSSCSRGSCSSGRS